MTIAVDHRAPAVLTPAATTTSVSADVDGPNAGYASLLLEDYLENPDAVPPEWRELFESGDSELVATHPGLQRLLETLRERRPATAQPRPPHRSRSGLRSRTRSGAAPRRRDAARRRRRCDGARQGPPDARAPRGPARSARLRAAGRSGARRDAADPAADARAAGADPGVRSSASTCRARRSCEALPALREVYCGTIAYEIEHLSDHARARLAAPGDRVRPLPRSRSSPRSGSGCSQRLSQRRGLRAVPAPRVPRPEAVLARGARRRWCRCSTRRSSSRPSTGAHEVVIGMAHRGRLNVLVHTIGRPYESILREFEGERTIDAVVDGRGGRHGRRQVPPRRRPERGATEHGEVTISLAPNPSHLEAVDPVDRGLDARRADRPLRRRRDPRPVRRACRS